MRQIVRFFVFCSAQAAGVALAVDIQVNTATDERNSDGDCSLREAVQAANSDSAVDACAAGSGADTINIPAGTYELTLGDTSDDDANAGGDLDLTASVKLMGAGADQTSIVLTHAQGNVIEVLGASSVELRGLRLTGMGGRTNGASAAVSILDTGATTTIADSSLENLAGRVDGGGIFARGNLTVVRTLFDSVGMYGIWWTQGNLTVTNSTFYNPDEGGIWIQASTGAVNVDHSTFTGAQPGLRGFLLGFPGQNPTLNVSNSIFAGPGTSALSLSGVLTSGGGNVTSDTQTVWTASDRQSQAALLGALQSNGGPTRTLMPAAGSPAIGFGSCNQSVDQRGTARPGTGCTAGAVEAVPIVCGDGIVAGSEQCDGTPCCTSGCVFAASGVSCGDSADSACSQPDTCNGAGLCQANHRPAGTACGGAPAVCSLQDTCDGLGVCADSGFAAAGTACGDQAVTTCSAADTCDAAGACQANHVVDGTSCDNGTFCDGADTCAAGACVAGTTPACASPQTCDEDGNLCVDPPVMTPDAGIPDASTPDAAVADAEVSPEDASSADASTSDEDASLADASVSRPDAGAADAGVADAGISEEDAGPTDEDDSDDGGCNCSTSPTPVRDNVIWSLFGVLFLLWCNRTKRTPRHQRAERRT